MARLEGGEPIALKGLADVLLGALKASQIIFGAVPDNLIKN